MHEQPIRGTVEAMDQHSHRERSAALGAALGRLSRARDLRPPIDDGFVPIALVTDRGELPAALPRRRGLFHFAQRGREFVESAN